MGKELLTIPEAAQRLGITERAAWQRVYRRQLPFRRWGHKIVIPAAELETFIKALPGLTAAEAVAKIEGAAR